MSDTASPQTVFPIHCRVPLPLIQSAAHQARKAFKEQSLKNLARSIELEGLQNPPTLRIVSCAKADCQGPKAEGIAGLPPAPEGAHWHLELISGERRVRACRLLNWTDMEVRIVQTVSEGEAAVKGMIENLQREDLDPIDEAEGFDQILKLNDAHWTQRQIAEATGKDEVYISKSLSLLKLPPDIQENFRQRKFSFEHGVEFVRLDNAKEIRRLAKKVGKKGLTVRQTRELIDKKQTDKSTKDEIKQEGQKFVDPVEDLWPDGEYQKSTESDGWTLKIAYPKPRKKEAAQKLLSDLFLRLSQAMAPTAPTL